MNLHEDPDAVTVDPLDFEAAIAERERRIAECPRTDSGPGHAWLLIREPGENPYFECEDCPAEIDDLIDSGLDHLYGSTYESDGHTVTFGQDAPDDAPEIRLPVTLDVENTVHPGGPWGDTEYDVLIHITERAVQQTTAQPHHPMLDCPFYKGEGQCITGCYSEPRCQNDEPSGGWKRGDAPDCSGECKIHRDVTPPGQDDIAHAHPECPRHGNPAKDAGQQTTGQVTS